MLTLESSINLTHHFPTGIMLIVMHCLWLLSGYFSFSFLWCPYGNPLRVASDRRAQELQRSTDKGAASLFQGPFNLNCCTSTSLFFFSSIIFVIRQTGGMKIYQDKLTCFLIFFFPESASILHLLLIYISVFWSNQFTVQLKKKKLITKQLSVICQSAPSQIQHASAFLKFQSSRFQS